MVSTTFPQDCEITSQNDKCTIVLKPFCRLAPQEPHFAEMLILCQKAELSPEMQLLVEVADSHCISRILMNLLFRESSAFPV